MERLIIRNLWNFDTTSSREANYFRNFEGLIADHNSMKLKNIKLGQTLQLNFWFNFNVVYKVEGKISKYAFYNNI